MLRYGTTLAHPEVTEYEGFFPIFRSPFHLTFDGLVLGAVCALVFREVWAWGAGSRLAGSERALLIVYIVALIAFVLVRIFGMTRTKTASAREP